MNRRTFTKTGFLAAAGTLSTGWLPSKGKSHILTMSFDDGFRNSFLKIADIYEQHGLSASLNVIASGHFSNFKAVDDWILPELMGNFEDWNALVARGHEVQPHSWKHLNLARQPVRKAKRLITKCLDYFEENLKGYDPRLAVFNFPFNASTPEIEAFTFTRVRALRTFGDGPVNPIPTKGGKLRISCASNGPNNIDAWVEKSINDFLADPKGGWLVLNVHGLDNEGWGPISTEYLTKLVARLVKVDHLEILSVREVMKRTV